MNLKEVFTTSIERESDQTVTGSDFMSTKPVRGELKEGKSINLVSLFGAFSSIGISEAEAVYKQIQKEADV